MIRIEGQGLHGGAPAVVTLSRGDGPSCVVKEGARARLAELEPVASARSTAVRSRDGRVAIATVEHLFAAIAALGAWEGLVVVIEGPEVPLADGGSRAFADAIAALEIPPRAPSLRVTVDGEVVVGGSRYAFRRADRVSASVSVDFGDARIAARARWDGDAEDFRDRIATARTFGFEREVMDLAARGLASHVAPESVVVIGEDRVLAAGRPFSADEPARHKLLDLVGDLGVHGGPPLGEIVAARPGHSATHAAVARALALGILARTP